MPSFHVIHNIPSPYRLHLFRVMNERLRNRGINFHVHFMARVHHNRLYWKINSEEIPFPHTFWPDLGPLIGTNKWHLNPGLVKFLINKPADFLLMGGLWNSVTGVLISLLAQRRVGIILVDGNIWIPGRISRLPLSIKQFLLRRYEFLAVPGERGNQYARFILGEPKRLPKIVVLPIIVDENLFRSSDVSDDRRNKIKSRFGINIDKKLVICPARLSPEKGICELVFKLTPTIMRDWVIVILGDGHLKGKMDHIIAKLKLCGYIKIFPSVPYSEMPSLYAGADLLLLPSLSEPYGVCVVEAMHSGLPILVSNRIGIYPEALHEGVNGWGFDPMDEAGIKAVIKVAFESPIEKLREMGRQSKLIANDFWASNKVVNNFLDTVLS